MPPGRGDRRNGGRLRRGRGDFAESEALSRFERARMQSSCRVLPTQNHSSRSFYQTPNQFSIRRAVDRVRNVATAYGIHRGAFDFSMRDEARNTLSHHSAWGREDRLRQHPVIFVSAGLIRPLDELEKEAMAFAGADTQCRAGHPEDAAFDVELHEARAPLAHPNLEHTAEDRSIVAGQDLLEKKALSDAAIKGVSTAVDAARTQIEANISTGQTTENKPECYPQDQHDSTAKDTPPFFFDLKGDKTTRGKTETALTGPCAKPSIASSESSEDVVLFKGRKWLAAKKSEARNRRNAPLGTTTNAAMSLSEIHREIKVVEASLESAAANNISVTKQSRKRGSGRSRRKGGAILFPEVDPDANAILDDYIANMASDSENLISSLLSGRRDLGGDHDAFDLGTQQSCESGISDVDTNQERTSLDGDEEEASGPEYDAVEFDFDDKSFARLLPRQEELANRSDKYIVLSDQATKSVRPFRKFSSLDDLDQTTLAQHNTPKGRRNKQPPKFNVYDARAEKALEKIWQADREIKKLRIMKREELRAQGVLERNVDPEDLQIKYPYGMRLKDVKLELRSFLLSSMETLSFPPMNKHAYKIIHKMATKFRFKSKSIGNGNDGQPSIYRTARTARYEAENEEDPLPDIEWATTRVGRKYFLRIDKKDRTGSPRKPGGGGGKALTYRDGEIVGASAPQIGKGNKGRTMLENMGWSSGMALGATKNKGILEPVVQVVKRSKAGLG